MTVVLAEKEKKQGIFEKMNLFCQKCYQEEGILEKDGKFQEGPDIFWGVFSSGHCLGTLGMKFSVNGSPSLPIEHYASFSLPNKGCFLPVSIRARVEFMRFSLEKKMKKREKILITQRLFDAAVEFFAPVVEVPFFEPGSITMFAFTFKKVAYLFNLATGLEVFEEVKEAEILVERIPPQSRCFLKKDPRVFIIPPEVIAQRWEKIRNSINPLDLVVSF